MGSSVSCGCANKTVVQVKQTNGFAQEFRSRATVAHVMELNPDHLVVRYTRRKSDGEKGQPRVTILNPDQRLIPGKTYLLYPIPQQYIRNPSHNPFLPAAAVDRPDCEKRRKRALRKLEAAIELQKPKMLSFQWKPSLDSIPESPPLYSRRTSSMSNSPRRHEGSPYQPLRVSSPSRLSLDKLPQTGRRVTQCKSQRRWLHRVTFHPRPRCFLLNQDIKRSRSLPREEEKPFPNCCGHENLSPDGHSCATLRRWTD